MKEQADGVREMISDLRRTEELIIRKRRKVEEEDLSVWGDNNEKAIDEECAEKYGLLLELVRDQILSPVRYKYSTETFDKKDFEEVDPTDISTTLVYRLLRGETERVPGSRKKHRQDFIDLTTIDKKKVREALTILISRYLTAHRAAELQVLLLNNTKSLGVMYDDETLSGHILEYLDHFGGCCESQYYSGPTPSQDNPPPVTFSNPIPETPDSNKFILNVASMFPSISSDIDDGDGGSTSSSNNTNDCDTKQGDRYFTPTDPFEDKKTPESGAQPGSNTLKLLKAMTGSVEDIVQCEWTALNTSIPEPKPELLNEEFCDALSQGLGIPPEGAVQGEVTKLNVYEHLITKERDCCKDRLCNHSVIPILLKYASGVARDVAAIQSPGLVERSALRCLTEVLRIVSSPTECKCILPSSVMYGVAHEVTLLYLRLNAPKYAVIFLWELSTPQACGGILTSQQLVTLNIYLLQLLLDVLPRTSFDVPPDGMLLSLHLPEGDFPIKDNGKRVLTMWEHQLLLSAGDDKFLQRYSNDIISKVRCAILKEGTPRKPFSTSDDISARLHSQIEEVIRQYEISQLPYTPKSENSLKSLSDWLTEIAYVLTIEANYSKGERLFHEAQSTVTDINHKVILAANHCALLICWGKRVVPALYYLHAPCRVLSGVGEARSTPPSMLTRLVVSVIRNSPTSLRYFLCPENSHLKSPEIRFLLFFERLRNRSVSRTEIVSQIAKSFPTALATTSCVAMTPVTATPVVLL